MPQQHKTVRLRIRRALPADVDAIYTLEAELFPEDKWSRGMILDELTGPHRSYFVLVDNADKLYGYAGVLTLGAEADVQTIAVAAAFHGQGYGAQLLRQLLESAQTAGATQIFLEVRADNQPAINLYHRFGFTQIGVRKAYYQPAGVDALVMRAAL